MKVTPLLPLGRTITDLDTFIAAGPMIELRAHQGTEVQVDVPPFSGCEPQQAVAVRSASGVFVIERYMAGLSWDDTDEPIPSLHTGISAAEQWKSSRPSHVFRLPEQASLTVPDLEAIRRNEANMKPNLERLCFQIETSQVLERSALITVRSRQDRRVSGFASAPPITVQKVDVVHV